jgi:hypothetical protein
LRVGIFPDKINSTPVQLGVGFSRSSTIKRGMTARIRFTLFEEDIYEPGEDQNEY